MTSLNQIASAIFNHLAATLKATGNEPYSIHQIMDEIIIERATIIKELEAAKQLQNKRSYIHSINCIPVDCSTISQCCNIDTYDKKLHFKIPTPLSTSYEEPVIYVGPIDRSASFDIIRGSSWESILKYSKFGKKKASVWFLPNKQDGFIFNPPTDDLAYISVDAIFENPLDLNAYACCPTEMGDSVEIPQWMISKIMDKIITRFANTHFRVNYKPNDQTGH